MALDGSQQGKAMSTTRADGSRKDSTPPGMGNVGKKNATPKTIKVKFAVYMQSNGDGSASPRFFRTTEEAEAVAKDCDERFCEDVDMFELEFDMKGNLVTKEDE
ncbi:MAG: hypothetical protein KGH64_04345 [Candidatus Micrarchaeota archaeon]|nr:hypothetical protein [Candidatus Micrarchaeota archaeon]